MLITYQTKVDISDPSTWEAPINEIGEYVKSLYLSRGAEAIIHSDPVYNHIGDSGVKESWRTCLAENARNKACRQVLAGLIDKWDEFGLCGTKNSGQYAVSAVFFAGGAGRFFGNSRPSLNYVLEPDPVILISEILSPPGSPCVVSQSEPVTTEREI